VLRPGERGTSEAHMPGVPHPLVYPENLAVGNLAYFLAAPTLVRLLCFVAGLPQMLCARPTGGRGC